MALVVSSRKDSFVCCLLFIIVSEASAQYNTVFCDNNKKGQTESATKPNPQYMLIGLLPLTAQWWQIEEAEEVNGKHKSAIQFNSKSKKAEILKGSQKHNHPEGEDEDRTTKFYFLQIN